MASPGNSGARRRGDGRLTHDLDPHDRAPQDACGVFGVWAPGEDVAKLTYYGLYALQHRGQESAGIAVSNSRQILVYKDMGLVSQVFDESTLAALKGHLAIGHSRYSTTGASTWNNAQPTFRPTADGSIALGHNGNLTNTRELQQLIADMPVELNELDIHARKLETSTNDTSLVTALLANHPDSSLEERAVEILPKLKGAYSFVWMDETTLYAARDPQGIRPLVLGRLERGWVVASETAALDIVGASYVREIEPGEMVAVDEHGLRSRRFAEAEAQGLPVRVRLPRPPRHPHLGPADPQRARRDRPPPGPRLPGRRRPGHPRPRVRHPRRHRVRRGQRHPLRHGPGEELLRRPHVHPAEPDHPPARHPAQAEPAARRHRGQAPRRRGRLDRARQHPARAGPDAS